MENKCEKIFIVCDRLAEMGGIQRVIRTLASGFAARGYDVELVSLSVAHSSPAMRANGNINEVTLMGERPWWGWLRKIRIGPVHFGGMRLERLSFIQKMKARNRIRRLCQENEWCTFIMMDIYSASVLIPALTVNARCIVQFHNSFEYLKGSRGFKAAKKISKEADKFLALTDSDANQFSDSGFRNVDWVFNPIPFSPGEIPRMKDRPKRIVAMGRFTQQKGFDVLVRAWGKISNSVPDWEVFIYGASSEMERRQLSDFAGNLSERIHVRLSVSDVEEHLVNARMYVLPSFYEGLPMVLLEAMSCGVACLATACSPGVKYLMDSIGSPTVKVGSEDDLAEKILFLIRNDEVVESIADNGVKLSGEFSLSRILDRWEKFINEQELSHDKH